MRFAFEEVVQVEVVSDPTVIDLAQVKADRQKRQGADIPDEGQPLRTVGRGRKCKHVKIDIDWHDPIVSCRDCGTTLDPYWVIRSLARKNDSQFWTLKRLEEHEARLEERNRRARERRGKLKAKREVDHE